MKTDAVTPIRAGISNAIVVLPLTEKDGSLTEQVFLQAGIRCVIASTLKQFCDFISEGVGAALLTEEAIENDRESLIRQTLSLQPAWSDLSLLILTLGGADSPVIARAFDELRNVVLLERPVRINTLLSTARAALRARHRQYQIRDYLWEREEQASKLARSNKDLEDFAYISSHDLQEPLRKVASFAGLLENKLAATLDETARHYLGVVSSGVTRMSELIQDLLSYSRVAQANEVMEVVDMNGVVDQVIADLDVLIRQESGKVTRQILPTVHGTASQLRHVIQNLVGNAIKFRGDAPPAVEISATHETDHVLFCVKDNGIGLDMQYRDQVFEVFRRLHGRSKYAGTGIGLAICKRIVERHKGRIWVESTPGKGSSFFFTLPV